MPSQMIKALFSGLVLGLLLTPPLQANTIQGMRFQDWGGNCSHQVCYLQQVLSKGEQPYMVTVIGYAQGKPHPTVIFELPPHADVKAGVSLSVDNKAAIKFSGDCQKNICRAGFALDRRMMKQFKKGRRATVTFISKSTKKPEALPVSLMGVSKGLNMLR